MATNLGMVGVINNATNCYLQAHSDGESHCSNTHRNEEETWFLIEIDKSKHLYTLQNWNNQRFLSKNPNGMCVGATVTYISPWETWTLLSGVPFGLPNCVAFRANNGKVMGANNPDDDFDDCGGEVAARDVVSPVADGSWPGWWRIEPATTPSSGQDVWNTIGGVVSGIAVDLGEAAVAEILVDIATAPA